MSQKIRSLLSVIVFFSLSSVQLSLQAMPVFDSANFWQNMRTAVSTAKTIINQAEQLKRQASQLQLQNIENANFNGGSFRWEDTRAYLQALAHNMQQGKALAYSMRNLDSEFQQRFPGFKATNDYQNDYKNWSTTSRDTLRATLTNAGLQADQFADEQSMMKEMQRLSETAEGRMKAAQVGNMIASHQVSQTQKLRELVIAQTNAQTAYMSYKVQQEQAIEANANAWIKHGSGLAFPGYKDQGFGANNLPSMKA